MKVIPLQSITAEKVGKVFYEAWITRFGVPYQEVATLELSYHGSGSTIYIGAISFINEFLRNQTPAYHGIPPSK